MKHDKNEPGSLARELAALENLKHVNVIEHIITPMEKPFKCILLEYGTDLFEYFISQTTPANMKPDLKAGLKYLHRQNWIHGDIKPENIIVVGDVCKFSDFDLSRDISKSYTNSRIDQPGTPGYYCPFFHPNDQPQILTKDLKVSDKWSLEVVCWIPENNFLPPYGPSPYLFNNRQTRVLDLVRARENVIKLLKKRRFARIFKRLQPVPDKTVDDIIYAGITKAISLSYLETELKRGEVRFSNREIIQERIRAYKSEKL